jgi:hypothetical protein
MFCLIYCFRVHEGKEDRFVQSWSQVTAAFIESAGALGSRGWAEEMTYLRYLRTAGADWLVA